MNNISVIESPELLDCEKNWIYIPENSLYGDINAHNKMNFIYNWHPHKIGAVNDNKLEIHTQFDTPKFFSRFSWFISHM